MEQDLAVSPRHFEDQREIATGSVCTGIVATQIDDEDLSETTSVVVLFAFGKTTHNGSQEGEAVHGRAFRVGCKFCDLCALRLISGPEWMCSVSVSHRHQWQDPNANGHMRGVQVFSSGSVSLEIVFSNPTFLA